MPDIATDEIAEFVCDTLSSFGPELEDVHRDATIEGLNLDSLDVVELSQVVEKRYRVGLKPEVFVGSETVGDLIDRIIAVVGA